MQNDENAHDDRDRPDIKPRGRPRGFDRRAALEAATRLFWRKGYAATSISDLTRELGIGAPSLYAAFASKEALYEEALAFYAAHYGRTVWGGFEDAPTAREAVRAYFFDSATGLTGCAADNPRGCMVTLSAAVSEVPQSLADNLQAARGDNYTRLLTRIERAMQEGELPETLDGAALARFLQSVQAGMSIMARDGASAQDLEAVAAVAMAGWDAWTAA